MSPANNVPAAIAALDRVFRPILCTFSQHDAPLHRFFHLILRRDQDLGEMQIAAAGEPPSRFAALGGYGPRSSDERLVDVLDAAAIDAGDRYDLSSMIPLIGIDATRHHRRPQRHQQPVDLLDAVQSGDGVVNQAIERREIGE